MRTQGHVAIRPLSARSARFGGGARSQARSAEDGRVGAALFLLDQTPEALDHLDSVDVLSDEKGGEHDRRSYDAFGARFGDLDALAKVGDDLTPHHMPQAALKFTSRNDGGALMMRRVEH